MADFSKFRTAVSGFNRTDVVNYIESTSIEHQKALRKLTDERDKLAAENARLQVELAGLQKRLEQAQADNDALSGQVNALAQEGSDLAEQLKKAEEAQQELLTRPDPQPSEPVPQPEEPETENEPDEPVQEPSLTEKELTAYRRAAKDGNGVNTSDMTPFACAAAGVCSRFQTLRCVGTVIGSSSRTAAAHQSVGKIPRGRCFFKNSRSASTIRIIALPPKIAACTPFIPRIPPQALLAAQALLLTVTDHSGSMQTAVPQNHQTPFRPAYRLPPSAPAAL